MELDFHTKVDLRKSAWRYLRLLDRVHLRRRHERSTGNRTVLQNAIFRYERFWLPILSDASNQSAELTPPWDVYYVWCLHILTSSKYRAFCREKYGRVLDHQFFEHGTEEDRSREKARKIWESRFYGQIFDINDQSNEVGHPSSELLETILKSEEKHHTFYYQVSLPHYRNAHFLDDAQDRYFNLLLLKHRKPSSDLCPSYDTELIRQAHILHPCEYEMDLKSFFDDVIDFDTFDHSFDVVTSYDHEEETALDTTKRLWNVSFGSPYEIAGTKHRGNHQFYDYFSEASQIHLTRTEPETMEIMLDEILVGDVWSKDRELTVEFRRLGQTSNSYISLYRISAKLGQKISTKGQTNHGRIEFNLKKNRGIELHIFGKTGRCCMKAETHVANVFLDPRTLYSDGEPLKSKEVFHEMPRISYGDPTVTFKCKITVENLAKPYVFSLDRDTFAPSPIPTDLKPFIKIDSWTKLDLLYMDSFSTAKHSVPLIGGGLTYTCNVACCRDFDLGAVLLYEKGTNLLTAAHTIGDDQLPLPEQVSASHLLSLDRNGEHAMLIRNKDGDWGICVMKPSMNLEDGSVRIVFEHLQKHHQKDTTFSFEDSTVMRIDGMIVDLYTGRVTLNSECTETAEYVTLAYVIGVLYVFTTGRQIPEVMMKTQTYKEKQGNSSHRSTIAKLRAKSSKKKYDIGESQSVRSAHAATLSTLKSRRKKRSLVCTMLLACGLKSNMRVDEDLTTMSFHSEVLLLPKTGTEESHLAHGLDEVHRHSFHQTLQETSRELHQSNNIVPHSGGFLSSSTGIGNLSFEPDEYPVTKRRESRTRKISESGLVPRRSVCYPDRDENDYEMPDFLNEDFLQERAKKIIENAIEGAVGALNQEGTNEQRERNRDGFILKDDLNMPQTKSISNGHAHVFISEGDEQAPKSISNTDWERFDKSDEKSLEDTRF